MENLTSLHRKPQKEMKKTDGASRMFLSAINGMARSSIKLKHAPICLTPEDTLLLKERKQKEALFVKNPDFLKILNVIEEDGVNNPSSEKRSSFDQAKYCPFSPISSNFSSTESSLNSFSEHNHSIKKDIIPSEGFLPSTVSQNSKNKLDIFETKNIFFSSAQNTCSLSDEAINTTNLNCPPNYNKKISFLRHSNFINKHESPVQHHQSVSDPLCQTKNVIPAPNFDGRLNTNILNPSNNYEFFKCDTSMNHANKHVSSLQNSYNLSHYTHENKDLVQSQTCNEKLTSDYELQNSYESQMFPHVPNYMQKLMPDHDERDLQCSFQRETNDSLLKYSDIIISKSPSNSFTSSSSLSYLEKDMPFSPISDFSSVESSLNCDSYEKLYSENSFASSTCERFPSFQYSQNELKDVREPSPQLQNCKKIAISQNKSKGNSVLLTDLIDAEILSIESEQNALPEPRSQMENCMEIDISQHKGNSAPLTILDLIDAEILNIESEQKVFADKSFSNDMLLQGNNVEMKASVNSWFNRDSSSHLKNDIPFSNFFPHAEKSLNHKKLHNENNFTSSIVSRFPSSPPHHYSENELNVSEQRLPQMRNRMEIDSSVHNANSAQITILDLINAEKLSKESKQKDLPDNYFSSDMLLKKNNLEMLAISNSLSEFTDDQKISKKFSNGVFPVGLFSDDILFKDESFIFYERQRILALTKKSLRELFPLDDIAQVKNIKSDGSCIESSDSISLWNFYNSKEDKVYEDLSHFSNLCDEILNQKIDAYFP